MFSRAAMFNREAQQRKFRAAEIIETLAPEKGATVVDIGAGGGYFAVRFAKAVGPEGTVYAVDTDESSLLYAALFNLIVMMGHYVDEDALKEALGRVGYTVADSYGFLPVQSFTVFRAV